MMKRIPTDDQLEELATMATSTESLVRSLAISNLLQYAKTMRSQLVLTTRPIRALELVTREDEETT